MQYLSGSRKCEEDGCDRPHLARGRCSMHYARLPHIREASARYERVNKRRQYKKAYNNGLIPKLRLKFRCAVVYRYDNDYRDRIFAATRRKRGTLEGKLYQKHYLAKRRAAGTISRDQLRVLWGNTSHCELCSLPLANDRHLDHIIPVCLGGKSELSNVRYVHPLCNMRRPNNGTDLSISFLQQHGLLERV